VRRFRVLTRVRVFDDAESCWRVFDQSLCGYSEDYVWVKHRVPSFLTLGMHLAVEGVLEGLAWRFLPRFFSNITFLLYDLCHGVICGFSVRSVLGFWVKMGCFRGGGCRCGRVYECV